MVVSVLCCCVLVVEMCVWVDLCVVLVVLNFCFDRLCGVLWVSLCVWV